MADVMVRPFATLTGKVERERHADSCEPLIDEIEELIRSAVDEASREYHHLIRKIFALRNHPSIKRSDC